MIFRMMPDGTHKPIHGNGRYLSLTDEQIKDILTHYRAKKIEMTQKEFCLENSISRDIYWRVTRLRIKQERDRQRVINIAHSLGFDICRATGIYG